MTAKKTKSVTTEKKSLSLEALEAQKIRYVNTAHVVLTPDETATVTAMSDSHSKHVIAAGLVRAALSSGLLPILPEPKLTSKAALQAEVERLRALLK